MFVRYIRKSGRISIPSEILERFELRRGDKVRLRKQGTCILIDQAFDGCIFCGSRNVKMYRDIPYCLICAISLNIQIKNDTRS